MARRGMYSSATCPMAMAVCTRVSTPSFLEEVLESEQFMTVPSMPM